MTELEQLKLEYLKKKQSIKNKIVWWAMVLLPLTLLIQFGLSSMRSMVVLPTEIIATGVFAILLAYFGVNYFQKKLFNKTDGNNIEGK